MVLTRLRQTFRDAFQLLRGRPLLFLPRLILTLASSALWILLADAVRNPFAASRTDLLVVAAGFLLLLPVQVWVYNAYFFIVKQEGWSLREAFRAGIGRVPHGIAAVLLPVVATLLLTVPGVLLIVSGIYRGVMWHVAVGAAYAVLALIVVAIRFYFVPVAAVLGTASFRENVRAGLDAAHKHRTEVTALTLFSFLLLATTVVLEGGLRQAGLIGFVAARLISAVISVYVLVLNPEFYLVALDEN